MTRRRTAPQVLSAPDAHDDAPAAESAVGSEPCARVGISGAEKDALVRRGTHAANVALAAACRRLAPCGRVTASAIAELRQLAVHAGPDSLPFFAVHYLDDCAAGGSPNTLDAKSRDLRALVAWFGEAKMSLGAQAWRSRDTRAFVAELLGKGRKPTTINRCLATLRHFARWLQDRHLVFGTLGLPTKDVKDVATEELTCRKLSDDELLALMEAGEERVRALDVESAAAMQAGRRDPTGRQRPRRDLALLATLYYAGLRVSEISVLRFAQYNGTHLLEVARKGRNVSRRVFMVPEGRRILDDYLVNERHRDDTEDPQSPLFLSTGHGDFLSRSDVSVALRRLARKANKTRPTERQVHVFPHKVRHTFGARVRKKTGSDFETAVALGHQSIQHVGRYARPTDEEREAALQSALQI